jgi:hypothetical protein
MENKISEKFVAGIWGQFITIRKLKHRRNDVEKDIDSFAFGGAWVC